MSIPQRRKSNAVRRAGDVAGQVAQQLLMPDWIPNDLSDQLVAHAQTIWGVRGALLQRLIATAYVLMGRGFPPMQALQIGARQLNLRPQQVTSTRPGMSEVQVRQYHRRQQQRGRRPGQNPQMRGRSQRELELEFMLADAAEAMARPPTPPAPRKFQLSPGRRSNMIEIVAKLDRDPNPMRRLSIKERNALLANLLQIINNNVPMTIAGIAGFQSLQNVVNRPRWRYLHQFPNARNRFLNALRSVEKQCGRSFQIPWL